MKARLINNIEKELANFTNQDDFNSKKVIYVKEKYSEACDGTTFIRATPAQIPDPEKYPRTEALPNFDFNEAQINGKKLKGFKLLKPVKRFPITENLLITRPDMENIIITHNNLDSEISMSDECGENSLNTEFIPDRDPELTIILSVEKIEKLMRLFRKNKTKSVKIAVYGPHEPVKFENNNRSDDNDIMALIMPMEY